MTSSVARWDAPPFRQPVLRFGHYVCDTDAMMRQILAAQDQLFARTALWACAVRLHPLDHAAILSRHEVEPGCLHGDGRPDRVYGIAIIRDPNADAGTAVLERCPRQHTAQDCRVAAANA